MLQCCPFVVSRSKEETQEKINNQFGKIQVLNIFCNQQFKFHPKFSLKHFPPRLHFYLFFKDKWSRVYFLQYILVFSTSEAVGLIIMLTRFSKAHNFANGNTSSTAFCYSLSVIQVTAPLLQL